MHQNKSGWWEQDHAGESVACAAANAMQAHRIARPVYSLSDLVSEDTEPSFLDNFPAWWEWCLRKHGYGPALSRRGAGIYRVANEAARQLHVNLERRMMESVSVPRHALYGESPLTSVASAVEHAEQFREQLWRGWVDAASMRAIVDFQPVPHEG